VLWRERRRMRGHRGHPPKYNNRIPDRNDRLSDRDAVGRGVRSRADRPFTAAPLISPFPDHSATTGLVLVHGVWALLSTLGPRG
jgi:hypothetical protein